MGTQITHPLAAYRSKTGETQAALANRVGCKRWMLNRIEKGERRPSPELAGRIQAATGIDARTLLGIPFEGAA